MDASVIRNEKIQKHNVEPYRFKVLSSSLADETIQDNVEPLSQDLSANIEQTPTNPPIQEPIKAPEPTQQEPTKSDEQNTAQDNFVEKLLKKTDELSSENIKLQMRLENKEAEFEKTLQEQSALAKEEGEKAGEARANEKFNEKLLDLQTQYSRSISLLEEEVQKLNDFIKKNESELANVAIDIAKEVIQKELTQDSSKIAKSLAVSLLKELETDTQKQIKVNPKDYEYLKESFTNDKLIEVKQDDAISQGGVIILSPSGNIEGTITKRMDKIKQMMDE